MNDSELYFEGCFSPGWLGDIPKIDPLEKTKYYPQFKSLETLQSELQDIKEHLQEVRERQWNLAEKMKFLNAGIAKN